METLDPTGTFYKALSLTSLYVPQNIRASQELLTPALEFSKKHSNAVLELNNQAPDSILNDPLHFYLADKREIPRDAVEAASHPENTRMVVLGSLGYGKSTLIQFLALRWAESSRTSRSNLTFPIIIELRLYAEARRRRDTCDFLDFLCHGSCVWWRFSKDELQQRLRTNSVTVYFDGLDEISNRSLYEEVVTSILRFANEFPKTRMLVTSRASSYQEVGLRRAGFKHYVLEEFTGFQTSVFINKWYYQLYGNLDSKILEKKTEDFADRIFDSVILRELAGCPLFLTVMLVLNRSGHMPRSRAELFEQFSIMLLDRWKVVDALREHPDLAQDANVLGIREKQNILRAIAHRMTTATNYPSNIISEAELETCIAKSIKSVVRSNPVSVARAMIRHLRERNGILRLDEVGYYAFVYPSFMEFFCADDLRHRLLVTKEINQQQLSRKLVQWNENINSWRDVICFLSGMITPRQTGMLIRKMLWLGKKSEHRNENIILASECLKEAKNQDQLGTDIVSSTRNALIRLSLQVKQDDKTNLVAARSVELLASIFEGDANIAKHLYTLINESKSVRVRSKSIYCLASGWKELHDTRARLQELARNSYYADVRRNALVLLAKEWRDPNCLSFLSKSCELEKKPKIQHDIIIEIYDGWSDNPDVCKWFMSFFSVTNNVGVKDLLMDLTARNKHNKTVLPWLKQIFNSHPDGHRRCFAVRQIAHYCQGQRDNMLWLMKLAKQDKDAEVRMVAFNALVGFWYKNTSVQLFLRNILEKSESNEMRRMAVYGLIGTLNSNQKTQSLFIQLAETDPDLNMRALFYMALYNNAGHNPETKRILNKIISNEPALIEELSSI